MDPNELNELRELIEFLKANEIAEFDLEKNDLKVRLKFKGAETPAAAAGVDMTQLARLMASAPAAATAPGSATGLAAEAGPAPVAAVTHHIVKSPIVGTFYESPSPGAPPFVKVGDTVELGQVLCIVEAMKLMNEIESDAAGEVMERIAQAGQPVQYGQSLFAIKAK